MIKATWRKSAIGYSSDFAATIMSLGFKKLNQTRELPDTDAVRGMLKKVDFMVSVEGTPWTPPKLKKYKIWRARSSKKNARGR